MQRDLGRTGLRVAPLGFGAGPLGDARLRDADAERLVRRAVELGIDLFDTAPSYGSSETRLGRALASVRDRVTIVTKGGYGVAGVPDWTPLAIARGIDQARARLGVEVLDVFLLHSCPRERLARGDLWEPLLRARESGAVRAVGYSGDGDALVYAVHHELVDVVECSVNLVDQEALDTALPAARARGLGVIAKRAMASAPWAHEGRPMRDDAAVYCDRFRAMLPALEDATPWDDVAVRFAAFAPGVASALVGTTRVEHLEAAVHAAERGDLEPARRQAIDAAFRQRAAGPGVV